MATLLAAAPSVASDITATAGKAVIIGLLIIDIDGTADPLAAIDRLADVCLPGTEVIAIGSRDDARLFRSLINAGAADYQVKPVDAQDLVETLRLTGADDLATGPIAAGVGQLVICAKSGLGLDVALARSGRELAPAAPELAAELQMTAAEPGFLPHRADSFANLAHRVPLPSVQVLADMMVQTERFGTPLAQALRVLAAEYRTGRLLRAEEQAARLPAMLTVPMIAFVLPPLFIVLIGPAVINSLAS